MLGAKKNNKIAFCARLVLGRAARSRNELESPENSRTAQSDMEVSSLVKYALERRKDVALKLAEKTSFKNPHETPTEEEQGFQL